MKEKENVIIIPMLENEYWWGGCVVDGFYMPYSKETNFSQIMTPNVTMNQAAPLLISNKGRFIWSEKGFDFSFSNNSILLQNVKGEIEKHESCKTLREAYKFAQALYFPTEGKAPPDIFFEKPQYNTWIELMYNQSETGIMNYARDIIKNGMPEGMLMIDCGWAEYYGSWKFHAGRFIHPKKMVDMLHDMGFKVMLWVCPFISPDTLEYRFLRDRGCLVKDKSGKPSIKEWWDGFSAVLDFTNPEAVSWFDQQLKYLVDQYGVDGFKFDAGDASFYSNDDLIFEKTDANTQSEFWALYGAKYEYNEFRACWKCGGKPIVQRLWDKRHSWDGPYSLEALIPDCLAEGVIGHPYVCPDMVGGGDYINFGENSNNLDSELFVRYAQCAALMPMMQFSAAPWRVLDKKHFELCKKAALLHEKFAPKILQLVKEASISGEPIIRYMEYVFPNGGFEGIRDQFMLGDDLLVAPVIKNKEYNREISFPSGKWESEVGEIILGPCRISVDAPIERLPYFLKINN